MKHCISGCVVTVLCLLLSFVAVNPVVMADNPERKLKQLQGEINDLQGSLGGLRTRRDAEQKKLRTIEKEIGRLAHDLRELEREQKKQKMRLRELEKQQQQQKAAIKQQTRSLMAQLRTAYITGRQEYLKLFLNQQEPQKIGRTLVYYHYFNQARVEHIARLRNRLTEISRLSVQIEQERHELFRLAEQQHRQKQALETSRQARSKVLAMLKQDISKGSSRLEQLRQDERRLKSLLSRLERERVKEPAEFSAPFGSPGSRLQWPVDGPIKARFGSPRTSVLRWKGVLIGAAEGQPVRAVSGGKVIFADWLRGYGLLIIIDHGSGYMSLYGHNQSLQKETGSKVKAREIISTVGSSGGNEHAGLYFEIRHNGQPVDPARWCVARK